MSIQIPQVAFILIKKDGYQDRILAYCHDIEALVTYILDVREYDPYNHLIRIGLDGGGGCSKLL